MLDKARIAYQIKKIAKIRGDRDDTSGSGGMTGSGTEKCMLMSDISIKKPMKVILMNKQALKVLNYTQEDITSMSINQLMPKYIADNHHHFVEEFMITGKTRFLKRKRELFMKQKQGSIIPVLTYLSVNNLSRKNMILIFEENP